RCWLTRPISRRITGMTRIAPTAKACASPETLEQLVAGTLPAADAELVREHLHSCVACQAKLEQLTDHPKLDEWSGAVDLAKQALQLEPHISDLLENLRGTPLPLRTPPPELDPTNGTTNAAAELPAALGS